MSSLDRINRARWSRDQKVRARDQFAAELPCADEARREKLAGLVQMAEAMRGSPHLATILAALDAEILGLSS